MKKKLHLQKSLFALLLALFLGMGTTYAADFSAVCSTGQTLYYNITDATNHYVEITFPVAVWEDDPWEGYTKPTGNITLPSSVSYNGTTYAVKAIGRAAFYNCSGLTGSLTIPNSVTSIGPYAFYYCSGLTGSLTIPNSVTTIETNAFSGSSGFTGSLTIPNSVTTIDSWAFYECSGFTGSLTIGNSVSSIGYGAFWACEGFTGSLTIPNSVTTIGDYAFFNCSGFTGSLTIGNSVTTIGNHAFRNCSGFTGSLTLGNSVTSIGPYAFYYCSGLTGSLTIPNSVTTIGEEAFFNCSSLSYMIVLPDTPPTLGAYAFYYVPTDIPVYVPCESLEDYQAASGWNAFTNMQCDPLTYSINADGISVTVTGHEDGAAATGTLAIPETKTIDGVTYAVTAIGSNAFDGCTGLTGSLNLPNSLTSIGTNAFRNCSGLTGNLIIPNSVTTINNQAFKDCSGLTSLNLPNSLTSIGTGVFRNCSGLTGNLIIPNSLTTINPQAFMRCSGLTSLTLPASVSSIGFLAFSGCEGLTTMTVFSPTPPSLGDNVFNNVPTDISVYVPCESWEDYQAASGWSDFTNMQCLETLTVYDGTDYNNRIPANIYYFDYFNRSQFVVPAADLMNMRGRPIRSMTFYTASINVPYTTVSNADVYLMEVDYTTISAYEPQASATVVYSGLFSIVSANGGGEMTINFSTPYVYQGGNLLVGIDNTEANGYKEIYFKGQTVNGASIWGANVSSTGTIPASQQDFIPKTSFVYAPSMCAPKTLPYTYGFEEEDEFDCWTMLDCDPYTGRSNASYSIHQGDYGFRFCYNTNPPQYLISPELKGTTGVDVSFYYKNYSNDYPETFQVGYSTTTQSLTAFTWGDEVTAQDKDNWMLYEESFPEGAKYIAVKYNSYDQMALFLDDFSFTPVFCPTEDQCELTFTLTDSYGDGWNGAAINVVNAETGIVLATMTNVTYDHANAPITEAYTLAVCDGRELRFEWVSGSYDSECSYVVTAANGTEIFSGSGAMSTPVIYTVNCSSGQTIALSAGTNWFSTNVEITLDDLKAALVAASSGTTITIKSQNSGQTTWNGRLWVGTLRTMDVSQMYMISVANACEITLEGLPIDPAEHPVTISNGPNWIGFPLGATMTITNAFAGFAASGDIVKSDGGGQATWNGRIWTGQLKNLEPGKGYIYQSAATGSRTFTFPTGAK